MKKVLRVGIAVAAIFVFGAASMSLAADKKQTRDRTKTPGSCKSHVEICIQDVSK